MPNKRSFPIVKILLVMLALFLIPKANALFPFGHKRQDTKNANDEANGNNSKLPIGFYTIQNKKLGPCPPCANREWKVPAQFGLGARNPRAYGPTRTYYIFNKNEKELLTSEQQSLIGRVVTPRRTGYSKPNNSGNTHAGWAAVKRSGETGLTNLGSGTLNDPRAVAVSGWERYQQALCKPIGSTTRST